VLLAGAPGTGNAGQSCGRRGWRAVL
jgi:hypothetical protein